MFSRGSRRGQFSAALRDKGSPYKGKSVPDGDTVLTGKSNTANGNPALKGMPKPVEAGAKTPNPSTKVPSATPSQSPKATKSKGVKFGKRGKSRSRLMNLANKF